MVSKDKIALIIFIASVVAILILLFFTISKSGLTGRVVSEIPEEKIICTDSDNGLDYNTKGIVKSCDSGDCIEKQDYCSGKSVVEYYCDKGVQSSSYECESCDSGVCLNKVDNYKYIGGGGGGGGSSNSGSSGSSSIAVSYQTYDLGELDSAKTIAISRGEKVNFVISGNVYTLVLDSNTNIQATFNVASQTSTLIIGQDTSLDLNSDSNSDLYIKLDSISMTTNKIKLILSAV